MKFLITGAAGYLGSQLTQYLLTQKHQVTAFDSMMYGCESLMFGVHNPDLKIVKGDIRDARTLAPYLSGVDCLIHLAGIVGEPACSSNLSASWDINFEASKAILNFAKEADIQKIIYLSTCSNYGVTKPNELADESNALNPLSEYARAKVGVENHILESLVDCCTILRLGTLCGLSARMRFDLLVNDIARAEALDEEILIYAPEAWRPYLAMDDAVRCISRVATSVWDYRENPVFNIVGENLKKSDLVDIVIKHNPDALISYRNVDPDLRDYKVSGKKFEKQFAIACNTTIESAMLAVSNAVADGYFSNPKSPHYSATPIVPFA